jgi:hypothetical protein
MPNTQYQKHLILGIGYQVVGMRYWVLPNHEAL